MGTDAALVAIGPFSEDVVKYLCYPSECYEDTKQGNTVYTIICWMSTTSGSEQLAEALGVEPWNFNQHFLLAEKIDVAKFVAVMKDSRDGNFDLDETMDVINTLKGKGFLFIYLPNG